MAKMTVAEAERNLVRTVERVAGEGERVTLTSDGKPVAAIVPAEDLELLEALEDASTWRRRAARSPRTDRASPGRR